MRLIRINLYSYVRYRDCLDQTAHGFFLLPLLARGQPCLLMVFGMVFLIDRRRSIRYHDPGFERILTRFSGIISHTHTAEAKQRPEQSDGIIAWAFLWSGFYDVSQPWCWYADMLLLLVGKVVFPALVGYGLSRKK